MERAVLWHVYEFDLLFSFSGIMYSSIQLGVANYRLRRAVHYSDSDTVTLGTGETDPLLGTTQVIPQTSLSCSVSPEADLCGGLGNKGAHWWSGADSQGTEQASCWDGRWEVQRWEGGRRQRSGHWLRGLPQHCGWAWPAS